MFGFDTELQDVADLNLGRPELELILGAGFLRQFIVQFDYPNQRMRLLTRDMADMKKLSNVKSKPDQETGSVLAKVRLNDEHNTWLMVDTGATGSTLLDRGIATKRGWLNKFPNEVVLGRGVISAGQLERFRLPSLKIGDFEIADTLVSVPAAGQKLELFRKETRTGSNLKRIQSKSKGILGYDVLKHFVVTIDYRIGKVHLEPGAAN
ncbi:MAG: aspartyl protease family protein [Pseudomonadota bacterium]|nr:aspartyl protease family protein [Pseudomonadota bacterium]